jgi:metal-dependent HD superfamily phosphatase/phosphodiesterase
MATTVDRILGQAYVEGHLAVLNDEELYPVEDNYILAMFVARHAGLTIEEALIAFRDYRDLLGRVRTAYESGYTDSNEDLSDLNQTL